MYSIYLFKRKDFKYKRFSNLSIFDCEKLFKESDCEMVHLYVDEDYMSHLITEKYLFYKDYDIVKIFED